MIEKTRLVHASHNSTQREYVAGGSKSSYKRIVDHYGMLAELK